MISSSNKTREKAWKIFSKYVRIASANEYGFSRCYTCPSIAHWKQLDAGHFIPRTYLPTMFDEMNVKPQCKSCNRMKDGRQDVFERRLRQEYGDEAIDAMIEKSKGSGSEPVSAVIKTYSAKLKELSIR